MATNYMRIDADGVFVEVHARDGNRDTADIRLLVGDGTEEGVEIWVSPTTAKVIALALLGATEDD